MFHQDGSFLTGWVGVYDWAGNLVGAASAGFGTFFGYLLGWLQ